MAQILIVDDDKFMRDYLGIALRKKDYDIQVVESGSAGIKVLLKKNLMLLSWISIWQE